MAEALLLVDFQRDFLDRAGRMPVAQNQVPDMIAATKILIDAARLSGGLVIALGTSFIVSIR